MDRDEIVRELEKHFNEMFNPNRRAEAIVTAIERTVEAKMGRCPHGWDAEGFPACPECGAVERTIAAQAGGEFGNKHDDPKDCPTWYDWCRCESALRETKPTRTPEADRLAEAEKILAPLHDCSDAAVRLMECPYCRLLTYIEDAAYKAARKEEGKS